MKNNEEINNALECCVTQGKCFGGRCKYFNGYPSCTRDLFRDALEYINELEARAPRWISVKERLPEECVDVVVFQRNGETSYQEIAHLLKKRWYRNGVQIEYITHWMPLPEAPEEG